MRALALSLVGPEEGLSLEPNYSSWISNGAEEAKSGMDIILHNDDKYTGNARRRVTPVPSKIVIKQGSDSIGNRSRLSIDKKGAAS